MTDFSGDSPTGAPVYQLSRHLCAEMRHGEFPEEEGEGQVDKPAGLQQPSCFENPSLRCLCAWHCLRSSLSPVRVTSVQTSKSIYSILSPLELHCSVCWTLVGERHSPGLPRKSPLPSNRFCTQQIRDLQITSWTLRSPVKTPELASHFISDILRVPATQDVEA